MPDLTEIQNSINEILSSSAFQMGIRAVGLYIALLWLASAFWAFRDMRQRTTNPVAPYLAAALVVLFLPAFFPFAILLYRIVRPKETIAEANDRALAEEAMLAEVAVRPHCGNCARPVHEEWIVCPTCRNRLRRVCPNCERLVELDWNICAWCGKDFERAEPMGAAFMPPTRPGGRPGPQAPPPGPMRPLPGQMLPGPPPPAAPMPPQPLAGER